MQSATVSSGSETNFATARQQTTPGYPPFTSLRKIFVPDSGHFHIASAWKFGNAIWVSQLRYSAYQVAKSRCPINPNSCLFLKEHNCLVISVQSALSDATLASLGMQTAGYLAQYKPGAAVLDLSGLDVIDSFSVLTLRRLYQICRLYAVRTVIAGIQPGIAISMSLRGLDIENAETAIDLTDALTMLNKTAGQARLTNGLRHGLH